MRDNNQRTVKIELLSQWKLEAEFRNKKQAGTRAEALASFRPPLSSRLCSPASKCWLSTIKTITSMKTKFNLSKQATWLAVLSVMRRRSRWQEEQAEACRGNSVLIYFDDFHNFTGFLDIFTILAFLLIFTIWPFWQASAERLHPNIEPKSYDIRHGL